MTDFSVPWDGEIKKVTVPDNNLENILVMHNRHSLSNPKERLKEILENPSGCEKLVDMLHTGDKVAIASSEYGRDPFTWLLAPVLEEVLTKSGVADENITLLTAPGTHQNKEQQIKNPLTKQVFGSLTNKYKLVIQDPDEYDNMRFLGVTSHNTPVFVNKIWADADVKIGFGEISPNLLADYTGGGKIVCPGISSRTTIGANHRLIMMPDFRKWLMTDKNVVRQDMHEIAKMAGLDFKIDVVINSRREIAGIFGGDFIKEYKEGHDFAEKEYGTRIKKKTDIAIWVKPDNFARAQGKNLRRGLHYLLLAADATTKEDGIVIGVFSCKDSHQSGDGKDLMLTPSDQLMWRLATNMKDPHDFCDWEHRKTLDVKNTFIVSKFGSETAQKYGAKYATNSFDEAIARAFKEKGKDATISVLIPPDNIASQYVHPIN